jgi:hypothetical protein
MCVALGHDSTTTLYAWIHFETKHLGCIRLANASPTMLCYILACPPDFYGFRDTHEFISTLKESNNLFTATMLFTLKNPRKRTTKHTSYPKDPLWLPYKLWTELTRRRWKMGLETL